MSSPKSSTALSQATRSREPVCVFLDASVILRAAFSNRGAASTLILRGLRGDATLIVSDYVLEEVARNLARKAPTAVPVFDLLRVALARNMRDASIGEVRAAASLVAIKDAPVVAAAAAAGVHFLASYDEVHLLSHAQQIEEH